MKKYSQLVNSLILLIFLVMSIGNIYAQDEGGNDDDLAKGSLTDITIVVASGVTGAILGISTLPFVEHPKDHLKSILVGGSIGIILGVGFVAYKQGTKSQSNFQTDFISPEKFDTKERYSWHQINHSTSTKFLSPSDRDISSVTYSFTF